MGHMATTPCGGGGVTCLELKMLDSTISENACLLVDSTINSCSSNSHRNSKIRVTESQFETNIYILIGKTHSKKKSQLFFHCIAEIKLPCYCVLALTDCSHSSLSDLI